MCAICKKNLLKQQKIRWQGKEIEANRTWFNQINLNAKSQSDNE